MRRPLGRWYTALFEAVTATGLLLAALIALPSCNLFVVEEPTLDPIIPATTRVLPRDALHDLIGGAVDYSELIFSLDSLYAQSLQSGDVIVCGSSAVTPNGLLRKVVACTRDARGLVVRTSGATLVDAIAQGTIRYSGPLNPALAPKLDSNDFGGADHLNRGSEAWFRAQVEEILYDRDGKSETRDDQVRLTGEVKFALTADLNISIEWFDIRSCRFTLGMTFDGTLTIESNIEAWSLEREKTLQRWVCPPIIVPVGFVPVTLVPEIVLKVGTEASIYSRFAVDGTVGASVAAGLEYRKGRGWAIKQSRDLDWELEPSIGIPSAEGKVYVKVEVQLKLFGTVGPTGAAKAGLTFTYDGQKRCVEVLGEVRVDVAMKADILGHKIAEYGVTVIDIRVNLFKHCGGCVDLVVEEIWLEPRNFRANENVTIRCRVRNAGTEASSPCAIEVRMGSSVSMVEIQSLPPGQDSVAPPVTIVWPDEQCRVITAEADSRREVRECREDNNSRTISVCPLTGCADLTPSNIWTEPLTFAPGQTITLYFEARNIGTLEAGPFTISVLFDGREVGRGTLEGLPVEKVLRGRRDNFKWPTDSDCHTVKVVLDTDNRVVECREDNNSLERRFCPSSTPAQLPDLIVKSISIRLKSPPPPWAEYEVIVIVQNVGSAPAQGPFKVDLARIECPVTGDSWGLGSRTIDRLGVGETYQWTWCCIGVPDPPPVSWCAILSAVVDPENVVRESNETNNRLEKRF